MRGDAAKKRNPGYFACQVPIDRYFADFACWDAKLVVELDGPTHEGREFHDLVRTEVLERCGYRVSRFDNGRVLADPGGVAEAIGAALRLRA